MRALLDVNVLIALLDAGHVHHTAANAWLHASVQKGWASCPLTQNGCLRILSTEGYPRRQPVGAVAARLLEATQTPFHEFWVDGISVLDPDRFEQGRWLNSRQITDACLLALAVDHDGTFVTLDRNVDLRLARGAELRHLTVI
jgi:uncharacterized protein